MSKLSINMRRMIVKYTDICWLITSWKANRKTRKRCELNNKCYIEAERRIQYREFKGNLYVALDNIPLIHLNGIDNDILKQCRETFQSYIFNQRGGNE